MRPGPALCPVIRPCAAPDLAEVTAIYDHHVTHGTGTFELDPPDLAEMARRWEDIQAKGLPWLVAEFDSRVLAFAYAGPFRARPAFRHCVEDSIYVRHDCRGQGLGHRLLDELVRQCETLGLRQMLALIGDAGNAASIDLHRRLGFEAAGVLKSAGWKFERWLDVVVMQRALGSGDSSPPPDAPTRP